MRNDLIISNAWFNQYHVLMIEFYYKGHVISSFDDYDSFKISHGKEFDKNIIEILNKKENKYSKTI